MKPSSVRLPAYIKPERYILTIQPDLEAFVFSGEETIIFRTEKPIRSLTLHSVELSIHTAFVEKMAVKSIHYNTKQETVTFIFPRVLSPGRHYLKLTFAGVLHDQLHGFYRSRYEHQGHIKHLATTQFEATDARRAFPCFDEPAHKAVFELTLRVPKHLTTVSNTNEARTSEYNDTLRDITFAPTPRMSTYLLAFVIGELESIEAESLRGVKVRAFTTPGKIEQARFALDTSIKLLDFYEHYFGIPYPLSRLDLIAIPDFAALAMENWGAITFRESALLTDPKFTPLAHRQGIVETIAHELTHQWFGNLVTMEWWTHLWLNESFATYMSYVAVDALFPQWNIWAEFVSDKTGWAMDLDSLQATHPVEVEVHHPDDIDEIFDGISYAKGASLIRMLAVFLGPRHFRDGLRSYLKKHAYQNAVTEDLWQAFERVSKKPVRKMMQTWTSQPGFPVVTQKITKRQLIINQQRFLINPSADSTSKTTWPVPLKINGTDHLLTRSQQSFPRKAVIGLLNPDYTAFQITAYDPETLQELTKTLPHQTVIERAGLIHDAFLLTEAGQMQLEQLFEFLPAYASEKSFTVWVEIMQGLGRIDTLLAQDPKLQQSLHAFCRNLLAQQKSRITWQPKAKEPGNTILLRGLLLTSLGRVGDKEVICQAQTLFRSGKSLSPDVRSSVYQLTALGGGGRDYQEMLRRYHQAELQEEKDRLAGGLIRFPKPPLIKKTLRFIFSDNVRSQDSPRYYRTAWQNQAAWPWLWEYMHTHWDLLYQRYGQGGRMLGYMIKGLESLSDPKDLREVKAFFQRRRVPGGTMTVKRTLETITARSVWLKRDRKNFKKLLH